MREGWIEYKFKDVASAVKGRLPKYKNQEEIGIPYLTANFLRSNKADFWIENLDGAVMAQDGDCLILWDGAGAGDLFTAKKGVVSSTMAVVTSKTDDVTRDFLTLILSSKASYIKETCRGTTVPHVSPDAISNMELAIPPISEQERIVDLISSVDDYISALHHYLENSTWARNAVLHDLMLAGGDGWIETTLGSVSILNPSEPPLSENDLFVPMDAVNVGKRWIQYTEEKKTRNGARARAGDILFARITPCLENGKVAQVQSSIERCGGSTEFIVIRGTDKCTSDFLYFWCTLKINREKARELMTGTTGRQRLSWQDLGRLSLFLPTISEQENIVSTIQALDSLCESTQASISRAKEFRRNLLSELLSGTHGIPSSYDSIVGLIG